MENNEAKVPQALKALEGKILNIINTKLPFPVERVEFDVLLPNRNAFTFRRLARYVVHFTFTTKTEFFTVYYTPGETTVDLERLRSCLAKAWRRIFRRKMFQQPLIDSIYSAIEEFNPEPNIFIKELNPVALYKACIEVEGDISGKLLARFKFSSDDQGIKWEVVELKKHH